MTLLLERQNEFYTDVSDLCLEMEYCLWKYWGDFDAYRIGKEDCLMASELIALTEKKLTEREENPIYKNGPGRKIYWRLDSWYKDFDFWNGHENIKKYSLLASTLFYYLECHADPNNEEWNEQCEVMGGFWLKRKRDKTRNPLPPLEEVKGEILLKKLKVEHNVGGVLYRDDPKKDEPDIEDYLTINEELEFIRKAYLETNTATAKMTGDKLQQLESGYQAIRAISRPAERMLAIQELQKQLHLSPKEMSLLIQELALEKSELNTKFSTFNGIMSADLRQEIVVDRLIMAGTCSMLGAESNCGKTSLFYQISEAVSTGSRLFDQLKTIQKKVLVIQVDESHVNARKKFGRMQLKPNNDNITFWWEWSSGQMVELETFIRKENIGLVLMDSFGKLFGQGADMNTCDSGFFMYDLNLIAAKTGAAFMIAHHLKKDQTKQKKDDSPRIPTLGDFFGSGYIVAGVRDAWGMWPKGTDIEGTPLFGLKYLKDNSGLIEKGWTMNLSGCLESQRFSLTGGSGGLDELEMRDNIRRKLHLALKTNTPNWLSVPDLEDKIDLFAKKANSKSVKRELLNLVDDAARTGIQRRSIKTESRGRPRFEYRFVH